MKRIFLKCFILLAVLIMPLHGTMAQSDESFVNKLTVSIPTEGYFDWLTEMTGLEQFKREHPEWELEFVVGPLADEPFTQGCDVYIGGANSFNIIQCLYSDRLMALDPYISDDTRKNVFALDLLTNKNGELCALPMFLGVPMVMVGNEEVYWWIDKAGYPLFKEEAFETWEGLYEWARGLRFEDGSISLIDGTNVIAIQISLMATAKGYDQVDCHTDEIKQLLTDWKRFKDAGLIYVWDPENPFADPPTLSFVSIANGLLLDWSYTDGEIPLFMPMPGIEENNSGVLVARLGVVAKDSPHAEMAVKFLECFTSLETQMALPTAGVTRKDVRQALFDFYNSGGPAAEDMQIDYGSPISEKSYQNYLYAMAHGRFAFDVYTTGSAPLLVVERYLRGEITLEATLDRLEELLRKKIARYLGDV